MKKLKILIADDEELLWELYEMILESEFSCEFTKVHNGEEAINLLKNGADFDFIISDYNMPNSNGGQVYLFNKAHSNIPFFLFSGGDLRDYKEFNDFSKVNQFNHFFNKPFDEQELLAAVATLALPKVTTEVKSSTPYVKIKLSYYAAHTSSNADVYIKLADDKFTKIINASENDATKTELINHYLEKKIEHIYLDRPHYEKFLSDIFIKFQEAIELGNPPETCFKIADYAFYVNTLGLNTIGISDIQIERINSEIQHTIKNLFTNAEAKAHFTKLCEDNGKSVGHSILIIYIAGAICHEANLAFTQTMTKICAAAFFHDFSILDLPYELAVKKINTINDERIYKLIFDHPIESAKFLSIANEVIGDTERIIQEHHELPNGDGYPKKLAANQISPLSCLFIISQEIAGCLLRNNYSQENLKNFLVNLEEEYDQGNFSKFYKIARSIF